MQRIIKWHDLPQKVIFWKEDVQFMGANKILVEVYGGKAADCG